MIVFCEECGSRNIVDAEAIKEGPAPRCDNCKTVLVLRGVPLGAASVSQKKGPRLKIKFRDTTMEISQSRPSVTMGRQSHNNLVVEDSRVSRSHARIVFRQNEFVLIDHSTNGTYVFIKGEKGMNLKQNELPLKGSGIFGLGRKVAPDSPEAIHFSVASS